jgi:hypothetical protein
MLEILKETDRRLVMMLGDRRSRWTKFILDKDAGCAWFERGRRWLPQRTLTVPLNEIAAIETRTVTGGGSDDILLTTASKVRLRLSGEPGSTQHAAERLRRFIDLAPVGEPHVTRTVMPRRAWGVRTAQAAAGLAVAAGSIWLLVQLGGPISDAAAKAGGLVASGAERIQNAFLLPACDAPESRDAIQELVRDRLGSGAVLADIASRGQSDGERLCTAVARRDGRTANVSYRNYWNGWTPKVRLSGEIVTLKLDATRTAAISEAMETFLAASRDSHRTGQPPRQTAQEIETALATVFGASDLAAEPLAPVEIDKALAWLKDADRVGAVYLLAGTGFDDFAKVPRTDAIQRRMRSNVVTFADEFGRYTDFQMVVLAAVANAQMRLIRGSEPADRTGTAAASGDDVKAQLSQALKSGLIALVYDGHNDVWRMARLRALSRTAPVAAKFLSRNDSRAVRDLALQTVDYFKDATVRAKVREVAELLSTP